MWIAALVFVLVAAREAAAECLPTIQVFIDTSNGVVTESGFMEIAVGAQGNFTCADVDWEAAKQRLDLQVVPPVTAIDAELAAACERVAPQINEAFAVVCDGTGSTAAPSLAPPFALGPSSEVPDPTSSSGGVGSYGDSGSGRKLAMSKLHRQKLYLSISLVQPSMS
jgi:hypothetical protein